MKVYIDNGPFKDGILKTYNIKVKSLIGKKIICYIITDDIGFYNFMPDNFNNLVSAYNYIEYSNKNNLYRYTRHIFYKTDMRIKFTKYMTFLIWKRRNVTINTIIRCIKSPIVTIKNIILRFKVKSKIQNFEEFYNK